MINDDETYDETYDVIALNTASKCLARMKGRWDPEFEPSVEEIVDYPMISLWRFSQFAFSSELAFRAGGFPYSVEHRLKPRTPIYACTEHAQFVDVS